MMQYSYFVQLSDAAQVKIAGHIDAVYQNTINEAVAAGVEVILAGIGVC